MLKLRKCGHKDLEKYYSIFNVDFDSDELIGKLSIHKAMITGNMEMLAFFDEDAGVDVGYAVVFTKGLYGYVLLKYFAILPWYREKGYGDSAMTLINERYADKQGIIAEITDFPDNDPDHQRKLYRFFAFFGYINSDADYRISGTEAHLMVKPMKGTAEIGPVSHRIIRDFYSRVLSPAAMDKMIDIRKIR